MRGSASPRSYSQQQRWAKNHWFRINWFINQNQWFLILFESFENDLIRDWFESLLLGLILIWFESFFFRIKINLDNMFWPQLPIPESHNEAKLVYSRLFAIFDMSASYIWVRDWSISITTTWRGRNTEGKGWKGRTVDRIGQDIHYFSGNHERIIEIWIMCSSETYFIICHVDDTTIQGIYSSMPAKKLH